MPACDFSCSVMPAHVNFCSVMPAHASLWLKHQHTMTMRTHAKCNGLTRTGHPCQITAASMMQDASGRSVAAPLRRGSPFCLFHMRPFCIQPATVEGPIALFYLDLAPVLRKERPNVLHHMICIVEHFTESTGNDGRGRLSGSDRRARSYPRP